MILVKCPKYGVGSDFFLLYFVPQNLKLFELVRVFWVKAVARLKKLVREAIICKIRELEAPNQAI